MKDISFRRKKSKTKIFLSVGIVLTVVLTGIGWAAVSQDLGKKAKPRPNLLQKQEVKGIEDENLTDKQDGSSEEQKTEDQNKTDEKTLTSAESATTPAPTPAPVAKPKPAPVKTYTAPKPAPAPAPVNGIYSTAGAQDYVESVILSLVNAERRTKGVCTLTNVAALAQAADIRAAEEAASSSPDHTRTNGTAFNTVYAQVGYTGYTAWGENLVWGTQSNFSFTAANLNTLANKMFTLWKNSPGHYANIIKGTYNQTGVGVVLKVSGNTLSWTGIQDFAKR